MNPAISFLGIFSSIVIWMITTAGLPAQCWTHLAVPCLTVICFCDPKILTKALAAEVRRPSWAVGASVGILPLLFLGTLPWNLLILLCSGFCLVKSLSHEKMMYMGGVWGESAKSVAWRAAAKFISKETRMSWKGDWAYCSPYSRKLVRKDLDYYYTLKLESNECRIPNSFFLDFRIEDCRIVCKYDSPESDGNSLEGSRQESRGSVEREGGVPDRLDWESLSSLDDSTKEIFALESSSYAKGIHPRPHSSNDGEYGIASSTLQPGSPTRVDSAEKYEGTNAVQKVSRIEISLSMLSGEELECRTYFQREPDRVAELKRAMEVLKDEGNVIFPSFSRNMGSTILTAHARCYEFEEVCNLILDKGYKLHKVHLENTYKCDISGNLVLDILGIILSVWMQYYQVNSAPTSSLVSILFLFGLIQFLILLVEYQGKLHFAKRLLFTFLKHTCNQNQIDRIYGYFLAKHRHLTFCNESYGYPITTRVRQICCFPNMSLPIFTDMPMYLPVERLIKRTSRTFDLNLLHLNLSISNNIDGGLMVQALIYTAFDGTEFYGNIYRVREEKMVAQLLAILTWLEKNNLIGVCEEWSARSLMHVYRYEELFRKVLEDGAVPWILSWREELEVRVEGSSAR